MVARRITTGVVVCLVQSAATRITTDWAGDANEIAGVAVAGDCIGATNRAGARFWEIRGLRHRCVSQRVISLSQSGTAVGSRDKPALPARPRSLSGFC